MGEAKRKMKLGQYPRAAEFEEKFQRVVDGEDVLHCGQCHAAAEPQVLIAFGACTCGKFVMSHHHQVDADLGQLLCGLMSLVELLLEQTKPRNNLTH